MENTINYSGGNILSDGFLNGEDLNGYFSLVFAREDICYLPVQHANFQSNKLAVPNAKFQEAKSYYFGQLIATTEMVAKKIKAANDNKSSGVDRILPKLLMETAEQISIPLVNCSTCQ